MRPDETGVSDEIKFLKEKYVGNDLHVKRLILLSIVSVKKQNPNWIRHRTFLKFGKLFVFFFTIQWTIWSGHRATSISTCWLFGNCKRTVHEFSLSELWSIPLGKNVFIHFYSDHSVVDHSWIHDIKHAILTAPGGVVTIFPVMFYASVIFSLSLFSLINIYDQIYISNI